LTGNPAGPPPKGQPEAKEQTASKDDLQILDVVVIELSHSKVFETETGAGKKTKIVVGDTTLGSSGFLSDNQLDGESHNREPHLIASEIRNDLRRRNTKDPVSLARFAPSIPNALVSDLSGLKTGLDFERKYPEARGYVEAWLPGYSKDRQTAVLRLWYGPTSHGATATYLLVKKGGRWTVVWSRMVHYL
jgi:hypothetical protein